MPCPPECGLLRYEDSATLTGDLPPLLPVRAGSGARDGRQWLVIRIVAAWQFMS